MGGKVNGGGEEERTAAEKYAAAESARRGDTDKTATREYGQNEITEAPGFPGASV